MAENKTFSTSSRKRSSVLIKSINSLAEGEENYLISILYFLKRIPADETTYKMN